MKEIETVKLVDEEDTTQKVKAVETIMSLIAFALILMSGYGLGVSETTAQTISAVVVAMFGWGMLRTLIRGIIVK